MSAEQQPRQHHLDRQDPGRLKMRGSSRPARRARKNQSARGHDAGDPATAFQRIYDEGRADVERWVRALGGRSSDLDDLVQEIFFVAYRRLGDFDHRNTTAWLYQIARRKMRDYRRLLWNRQLFTERTLSTFENLLETRADPLNRLETREKAKILAYLLERLPDAQRTVFVLSEIEGYDGLEIAQLLQIPVNTVWARIHNARRKLQSGLRAFEGRQARLKR
jgi:RNA polymerase sigma-70 factor (ECF subfamily)